MCVTFSKQQNTNTKHMAEEHVQDEVQDQEVSLQETQEESTDSANPNPSPEEFLASFDWAKYEEGIETEQKPCTCVLVLLRACRSFRI